MVHGDADWLQLGDLVLDGPIDLVEGGDTSELLGQLLVASSLLGVLPKLNKEGVNIIFCLCSWIT